MEDPLPVVGDLIAIRFVDREDLRLLVKAYDPAEGLWTVLCSDTNELALVVFDENKNYRFIAEGWFKEPWEA